MLSVNLGPLPIPTDRFIFMLALLVTVVVGRVEASRQNAKQGADAAVALPPVRVGACLSDMLLAGLLVARVAFVAQWFALYAPSPWSMLDVRDGGFALWPGLAAAALVAGYQVRRHVRLRRPLAWGLLAGALTWGALYVALHPAEGPASRLPTLTLTQLDGQAVQLAALAHGKPLVVNLWATWCPPCRREMPVLAEAQKQHPDLQFVFANQGEEAATVLRYLAASPLGLSGVVFDPTSSLGTAVGSRALPTTLFYDANGRLVNSHLGELSAGSLAQQLQGLK